ncbi:hypothetical protein RI129_011169 [Pyrocoelia pectoralis]|uniref:Uncharacterized protein n=1 Tax=Pyrocoelia pectoralis TaxID=417401 RepID=A0AAN7ZIJ4_9COLE
MAFLLPHMKDKCRMSSLLNDNHADDEEGETEAQDLIFGNEEGQDETNNITSETVTTVPSSETVATMPKQDVKKKKIVPQRKRPIESATSTVMNYIMNQKELEQKNEVRTGTDSLDFFFDSIKVTAQFFTCRYSYDKSENF